MVESSSFKSNSGLEHDTCHLHAPKWLYFCTFSTQNGHARYRPSHQTWAACAALRLKDLQLCNLWRQSSWWRRAVGAPMDECGEFFVAAPLSDMEAVSPWNLLVGRIYRCMRNLVRFFGICREPHQNFQKVQNKNESTPLPPQCFICSIFNAWYVVYSVLHM